MYSNIVYLLGEKYAPIAKTLDWKEPIPGDVKVNQKKLAELMVLAALIYLQENKFINIYFKEDQFLFFKSKNIYIKKISEDDGTLNSIEFSLLHCIKGEEKVFDIITKLTRGQASNPWQKTIDLCKTELEQRGIITISRAAKSLFGVAAKIEQTGDYPEQETVTRNWNQSYENFKLDAALSDKILTEISKSLYSMLEQNSAGSY